jgi:hypothetical protein
VSAEIETEGLSKRFLDKLNPKGYCPGFQLWKVTVTEPEEYAGEYLMAGDHANTVETRLFFATNGAIREAASIEHIGRNPDADKWDELRAKDRR